MRTEEVILVDSYDVGIGTMDKMEAHRTGQLHRAFSIFITNSAGDMLLQKRSRQKYHSGGLWSNACCSHPMPGEDTLEAAHRRLQEELGFDCDLTKAFDFVYRSELDNDLIEHEFDHVFLGTYDGPIDVNRDEASECIHFPLAEIDLLLRMSPDHFTTWFGIAYPQVSEILTGNESSLNARTILNRFNR